MAKFLVFMVLVSMSCVISVKHERKVINIAVFLDADEQNEIAILALSSIIRTVYSRTNYLLRPLIHRMHKYEVFKTGQLACSLLEQGVSAIFGPESPEINDIVQSISMSLQIPQFQTFWNSRLKTLYDHQGYNGNEIYTFNLHPSPTNLAKALATLVRENDWKNYIVIYENDEGLLRLQEALKRRNTQEPAIIFKKLGDRENYRSMLKEIKHTGMLHFILDCETENILEVLKEANEQKLLTEFHSYILTSLDAHTLNWFELKGVSSNITAFRLVDPSSNIVKEAASVWTLVMKYSEDYLHPYWNASEDIDLFNNKHFSEITSFNIRTKTALFYDAVNLFFNTFAEMEKKELLIIKPLSCQASEKSSHGTKLSQALKKVHSEVGLLSGPIKGFDSYGYRKNFQLKIVELDEKRFRTIGTWTPQKADKIDFTVTVEDRDTETKRKIQQMTFRVVSRVGAPYFIRKEDPPGRILKGNDRYEGYSIDLMKEICKPNNLNCSFTFEPVSDGMYGNYDPNTKKWNGLIKDLIEFRAELAVCDLTITYERKTAVDFTVPFMTLGVSILYSKAVKEPPELLSFSHPLSLDVWLYMFTAYLLISITIFLVARGISTRLVAAMWWFFVLIMIACYTANMTAFLTMERMGPTIESAEDLAAQNKIKYGCVKGGSTASFFKDTNFSTYHRMWVQMESAEPSVFETSNKDGVKRVLTSKRKYAFLMESSNIEYEMERNCDLIQVGNNLDSKGYGIAMRTNAPYRKSFNEAILKMQEMGVLVRLKDKWWKEMHGGGQCTKDKHSEDATATELGLDHVGGVFVVLAVGVCLAMLIAICEFLWNVRKVTVTEKVAPKEAFMRELHFALNIWARKKAVLNSASRSPSALPAERLSNKSR
ncbi:unnamed protein product [Acanthoscelides obtectus]|uniref:Uncharacterized protein n=1 Tax=Acanthoscelides obtectus TaxID=200917 RepID=A0A9P0NXW8_ACAOB|nr:unnamed protein product [Acanthoscelides obtectus]CAK1640710.1 Glutamate receptor ionotropic, kainate 2 [Acanthoscelides obtectus]